MKKILTALFVMLGMAVTVQAQRAELQIGYGGYTQMDATNMCNGGNQNTAWGAVTAGVNFDVTSKFHLGASYTFSSSSYKRQPTARISTTTSSCSTAAMITGATAS